LIFSSSGLPVVTNTDENLCVRAFNLLKKEYPQLPSVQMHLHKVIPMGAGLGGGSSDAAFTLKLINQKYQLGIGDENLKSFALQLGSDCPFFIDPVACIATGRGEEMQPIQIDLSGYTIVLVYPGIHISTSWAFSAIEPTEKHQDFRQLLSHSVEDWKHFLFNDFEIPVFKAFPQIAEIKKSLYQQGAVFSAMSGSGSAVYGLFKLKPSISGFFDPSYRVFIF
jgi:4-diphosphocytidyl-2-C-methyl-D-erythritol kinase